MVRDLSAPWQAHAGRLGEELEKIHDAVERVTEEAIDLLGNDYPSTTPWHPLGISSPSMLTISERSGVTGCFGRGYTSLPGFDHWAEPALVQLRRDLRYLSDGLKVRTSQFSSMT